MSDLKERTFLYPWCEEVSEWLELGINTDWENPIILPLKRSDQPTLWFAGTQNSKTASQLGIELFAHIGPSYSDFTGNPWDGDDHDEFERFLVDNLDSSVYRFTSLLQNGDERIARCLSIFRSSLEKRPQPKKVRIASSQIIRSEFDKALVLGNEPNALILKNELLSSGRLSAENRIYLEIRYLVGLGKHADLIKSEKILGQLTNLRLPRQILQDLMISYYNFFIKPIENGEDAKSNIEQFKSYTRTYGTFFQTRRGLNDSSVLKTFLLYDICHRKIDKQSFEGRASEIADGKEFVQGVRKFISPPKPPTDGLAHANAVFDELDYDVAFPLFLKLDPTKEIVNKALVCAHVIGTKEVAAKICKFVDASNLDIDTDLQRTKEFYVKAKITIEDTEQNVSGWVDWLDFITTKNNMDEAERIIEEDGGTWSIKPLLNSDDALQTLLDSYDTHIHIIQKAMVTILSQLEGAEDFEDTQAKSLLQDLLLINLMAEAPSALDLEIINQLAVAYLPTGLSEREYKDFVENAIDVFGRVASQNNLPWALDLLDILSVNSCPDDGIRLMFFVSVIDFALRQLHRMDLAQYETLKFLSADYGDDLHPSFHEKAQKLREASRTETELDYGTVKIGIYTLLEQAAQRSANILEKMYPNISVGTNNDHVCTEKLKSLSKTADLFVFSWRSSKHQAYFCVKDHQPNDKLLLQPPGKGSASIVKVVADNIDKVFN